MRTVQNSALGECPSCKRPIEVEATYEVGATANPGPTDSKTLVPVTGSAPLKLLGLKVSHNCVPGVKRPEAPAEREKARTPRAGNTG